MITQLKIVYFAAALTVLIAVVPVSAVIAQNGTIINQGATIFIGEEGLNVTHALNGAWYGASCGVDVDCYNWSRVPTLTTIGWWASAAEIYNTAPSRVIDLSTRYRYMTVAPSDFVGYTGNWYLVDSNGKAYNLPTYVTDAHPQCKCTAAGCFAALVFTVADPSLDIRIWDYTTNNDVTGKSVPQGEKLGFRIDTNMYPAVDSNFRDNVVDVTSYHAATDTYQYTAYDNPTLHYNCSEPRKQLWINSTRQEATCKACLQYRYIPYNLTYWVDDWVGWATWMSSPGGCYKSRGMAVYYNDGRYEDPTMVAYKPFRGNSSANGTLTWPWYLDDEYWHPAPGDWATNLSYWGVNPDCGGSAHLDKTMTSGGALDGFIDIKVKDEANAQLNKLYNNTASEPVSGPYPLLKNFVDTQPFFWGTGTSSVVKVNSDNRPTNGYAWDTGALDALNQYAYPVGTYTISAESKLNKMKDNYKQGGADYVGKTVSQSYTVTLVTDTVQIGTNKPAVTRGSPFSIAVSGRPSSFYYLWVKDTSGLTGGPNNQAPMISLGQNGVYLDPPEGPDFPIGSYQYEDGGGQIIKMNVGTDPVFNGTRYYGKIRTPTSGTRYIQFETDSLTRNMTFTIRVENLFGRLYKSDEVNITVTKKAQIPSPTTTVTTIVPAYSQDQYGGSNDNSSDAVISPVTVTENIGGNSAAGKVTVTGTHLSELIVTGTVQSGPGSGLTAPPGTAFQYLTLVPARYSTITNALIEFTVPQSWLDKNHIAPGSIVLYRLTSDGWIALPTTMLYAKDGFMYFSAQSPGFSLFAIAGMPATATPLPIKPTPAAFSSPVQEQAPAAVAKVPVTTETTPLPTAPDAPAGSSGIPVTPALVVLGCVGLVGGGIVARRWWIRRQNPALFLDYD
jgi:PGF-pre-PGF domain-containing protein